MFTAAAIAVDSIGSRLRAQRALAAQTERAEAEQERRAVLEERTRIARELHDVVAHHMSLIAVQAETAPYRLSGLPEPVRAEFAALSAAAREALADMRRLLGVLRHDQPAPRAPQPQLADLPALVDAARRAGVPVELSVARRAGPGAVRGRRCARTGSCRSRCPTPASTRPARRSPCRWARTRARCCSGWPTARPRPERASWEPGPPGTGSRPGHGLTGMRERVALLGGSLSAGPAPGGGFVVSARLPLGGTA